MGLTRAEELLFGVNGGSLSAAASEQHKWLPSTLTRSKSGGAALSSVTHKQIKTVAKLSEHNFSHYDACSSAESCWSQDQVPSAPRASCSAPLPWFNAEQSHAMFEFDVQLSANLNQGRENWHPGLASCCGAASPGLAVASPRSSNAHSAFDSTILADGCQHHVNLHPSTSIGTTAGNHQQHSLYPIAEDKGLQSSSHGSSGEGLSQLRRSSSELCSDLWSNNVRNQPADGNMLDTSATQRRQQGLLKEAGLSFSETWLQLEEEIVQLLLMTHKLSAAANAAPPDTPVAAACAAALRMHDATLTRALETRHALEHALENALDLAATEAMEAVQEDALCWHHDGAGTALHGTPAPATAAPAAYGTRSSQDHVDAWLASNEDDAADYMWQQMQQQAIYSQQQQQQQHQTQQQLHVPAGAPPGSTARDCASAEPLWHAAAASHEQADIPVHLLKLLPML